MTSFGFVTDLVLAENLHRANELILELVIQTNLSSNQDREILLSSLRKAIIIQIASVVEALLFYQLKINCQELEFELKDAWDYFEAHKIHNSPHSTEEIVWCKRRPVKKTLLNLDFFHLIQISADKKIVTDKKLLTDLEKLRKLRNKMHLGGLTTVETIYQPADQEFGFEVLEKVKHLVEQKVANG